MSELPNLARPLAHPLAFWVALVLALVLGITADSSGSALFRPLAEIAGVAFLLIVLWHFTYLALFMGTPSRLRQQLALGAPLVLISGMMLSGYFSDDHPIQAALGLTAAASSISLLVLTSTGLAQVFGQGSALAIAGYVFVLFYFPISGFFYFKKSHTADGLPRRAKSEFAPMQSYPPPERDRAEDYVAFWHRFQRETGETADAPRNIDAFGDSPEMHDELLALVLSGTKQATASLARWYTEDDLPEPGDLALITDGSGAPRCVIRTTQVDIIPVREVDADFAWAEGEGDRSLDDWITEHRKFWQREAAREGFEYSDDLDVVCERFELVWAG